MNRKQKILNSIIAMTILFIWGHSLMPGDLSAEESSRALDLLKPFLEIFFGKGNVTDHLVRKLAHFSEYALLGCEFCLRQQFLRTAFQTVPAAASTPIIPGTVQTPAIPVAVPAPAISGAAFSPWLMQALRVLAPCLAVCFIDETLQLFVPGRGGMIEDMWIDLAGAIAGMLFGLLLRGSSGKQSAGKSIRHECSSAFAGIKPRSNMEIERKWLIRKEQIPYDLGELPSYTIEQCYVSFSPVIRIRKKNGGERYVMTVKSSGSGISREEFELPLTKEQYDALYRKHEGNVIQKTRFLKEENGHTLEIDVFSGDLSGLCYLEIEFPTKEEAEAYPTPDWAAADVSERGEYANAYLAQFGCPGCLIPG